MVLDFPIDTLKKNMRSHALVLRERIAPSLREHAALAVSRHFLTLKFERGSVVSAYWPLQAELDVRPSMEALMLMGHEICLPVMASPKGPVSFRRWTPETVLEDGPFGTRQPPEPAQEMVPSVLLIPMLAFDRGGNRLGFGGGYYDRTIGRLRETGRPLCVGIAFSEQEAPVVPAEEGDQRLDFVLTEKEIISCVS